MSDFTKKPVIEIAGEELRPDAGIVDAPPEKQNGGMQALAEREYHHHRAPLPEAHKPPAPVFPRSIMVTLAAGILAGLIVGWLAGVLLLENILLVEGWEGLYSMSPFTFRAFWALMGAAAGIGLGGVAGLLSAPGPESHG